MVTVSNPDTPVTEEIQNSSVTVPAGEVWDVTLRWGQEGSTAGLTINGVSEFQDNSEGISADIVLTGGDTVSSDDDSCGAMINGWEVSSTVDNTPVTSALDAGESVTVPTGETWVVSIYYSMNTDRLTINGTHVTNQEGGVIEDVVLEAGDTVAVPSSTGHDCAYVSGYKI